MGSQQTPSDHITDNAQAGVSYNMTWLSVAAYPA